MVGTLSFSSKDECDIEQIRNILISLVREHKPDKVVHRTHYRPSRAYSTQLIHELPLCFVDLFLDTEQEDLGGSNWWLRMRLLTDDFSWSLRKVLPSTNVNAYLEYNDATDILRELSEKFGTGTHSTYDSSPSAAILSFCSKRMAIIPCIRHREELILESAPRFNVCLDYAHIDRGLKYNIATVSVSLEPMLKTEDMRESKPLETLLQDLPQKELALLTEIPLVSELRENDTLVSSKAKYFLQQRNPNARALRHVQKFPDALCMKDNVTADHMLRAHPYFYCPEPSLLFLCHLFSALKEMLLPLPVVIVKERGEGYHEDFPALVWKDWYVEIKSSSVTLTDTLDVVVQAWKRSSAREDAIAVSALVSNIVNYLLQQLPTPLISISQRKRGEQAKRDHRIASEFFGLGSLLPPD